MISGWRSWRSSNTPNRTASSSIPPSTRLPTSIPGLARKTSAQNPSRGKCSRAFRSFSDYIRDYDLQRAEGVLLRHLNSVYKVLAQTVPDAAKNDAVREMELYLRTMIAPGGFQPAGRMGKNARSQLPARAKSRKPVRPARKKRRRTYARRQGVHRRRSATAFSVSCADW